MLHNSNESNKQQRKKKTLNGKIIHQFSSSIISISNNLFSHSSMKAKNNKVETV